MGLGFRAWEEPLLAFSHARPLLVAAAAPSRHLSVQTSRIEGV